MRIKAEYRDGAGSGSLERMSVLCSAAIRSRPLLILRSHVDTTHVTMHNVLYSALCTVCITLQATEFGPEQSVDVTTVITSPTVEGCQGPLSSWRSVPRSDHPGPCGPTFPLFCLSARAARCLSTLCKLSRSRSDPEIAVCTGLSMHRCTGTNRLDADCEIPVRLVAPP